MMGLVADTILFCMVIQGAERKNKDDAKQIGKHLERVYGKLLEKFWMNICLIYMIAEGNPRQHPFWLMYNQPKPYSVLNEIPTTPQQSTEDALLSSSPPSEDSAAENDMEALLTRSQQQQQHLASDSAVAGSTQRRAASSSPPNNTQLSSSSLLLQTLPCHFSQQQQPSLHHKRTFSELDATSSNDHGQYLNCTASGNAMHNCDTMSSSQVTTGMLLCTTLMHAHDHTHMHIDAQAVHYTSMSKLLNTNAFIHHHRHHLAPRMIKRSFSTLFLIASPRMI